jgi:dTDP-4-dehydrorhamnose reductase
VDDQVSSPSYTVDLAEATYKLMATGNFGLYHMTNSGSASRFEWAEHILRCIGWDGELESAKSADFLTPARRPPYSVLDNFPLERTIGGPMPSWRDATERFLRETTA